MELKKVVICGGGIIGASIAYYLSLKPGYSITVIERTEIAASASGKAGGFLAKNWGEGATKTLHTRSFDLHETLAKDLGVESYRKIPTLTCGKRTNKLKEVSWMNQKCGGKLMDNSNDTAQVDPKELTTRLIADAEGRGVKVIFGIVEGPVIDIDIENNGDKRKITGIKLSNQEIIACDIMIVAMGAWSTITGKWFNINIPLEGIKSTSVIFNDVSEITNNPYALFCEEDENGCHLEVYPRTNGVVYCCGLGGNDYIHLESLEKGGDSESPEKVLANPQRVSCAVKSLSNITSCIERQPDISQACLRPCSPDGLPIMGIIPGYEGAYVCTGHNCWGILWAPISGLIMSELICDGKSSIELSPFSVERYMIQKENRGRKKNVENVGEQW